MIGRPIEPVPAVTPDVALDLLSGNGMPAVATEAIAALAFAELARALFLDDDPRGRRVVCCCGDGAHGRIVHRAGLWLASWGARVLSLTTDSRPQSDADDVDLLLDGISGLVSPLSAQEQALARWADLAPSPVLSLQAPAGLDPDTAQPGEVAIHATATLALGLPTHAVLDPDAADHVGELYLADMGVPPDLYAVLGAEVESGTLFAGSRILRIR